MSFAEVELARVESQIQNLELKIKRYHIGTRSMEYRDLKELLVYRKQLQQEVAEAKAQHERQTGKLSGHFVQVYFDV